MTGNRGPSSWLLDEDTDWMARAACVGKPPVFFGPDNEHKRAREVREAAAKAICAVCPVIDDCRRYTSLIRPVDGVWAGLTEGQRRGKRRRPGRPPAEGPPAPRRRTVDSAYGRAA